MEKLSARTLALAGDVATTTALRSRFDWLRKPDPGAVASPLLMMPFDLLYCDRRDLTDEEFQAQKKKLLSQGGGLTIPSPTA